MVSLQIKSSYKDKYNPEDIGPLKESIAPYYSNLGTMKEVDAEGIFKAYIPNFLYKPPYGYPRYVDTQFIKNLSKNPYVFSVIKTLCDEATSIDWDIKVKEEYNDQDNTGYEADIKRIKRFFRNPNGNYESFEQILRGVLTSIFTLDSGVIVKVFDSEMNMKQIFCRDGSLFLKNPDIYGYLGDRADFVPPLNPLFQDLTTNFAVPNVDNKELLMQQYDTVYRQKAAYFQYGWTAGSMPVPFGKREIVYVMHNPQPDSIYGLSPVEVLADIIMSLVYGSQYNLDFYTNNNMPDGVIQLLGADQQKIKQFRENFDSKFKFLDTQTNKMRKKFFTYPITSVPVQFTPFMLKPTDIELIAQQEWFTKVLWMSFGVTANEMGVTDTVNKASSEEQGKIYKRKALRPILKTLKYFIDTQIMPEFYNQGGKIPDFSDVPLEFTFEDYDFDEDQQKHNLLEQELRMGVKTTEMVAKELKVNVDLLKETKQKMQEQTVSSNDGDKVDVAAKEDKKIIDVNEEAVSTKSELSQGIRTELEHKKTFAYIRRYTLEHPGEFPSDEQIAKRIAEDHLKEDTDYYTNLSKIEEKDVAQKKEVASAKRDSNALVKDVEGYIDEMHIVFDKFLDSLPDDSLRQ